MDPGEDHAAGLIQALPDGTFTLLVPADPGQAALPGDAGQAPSIAGRVPRRPAV